MRGFQCTCRRLPAVLDYPWLALHLDGTSVVASPLISLMRDPAGKLEAAGVAAEQLDNAQQASEQDASMARIAQARGLPWRAHAFPCRAFTADRWS